MSSLTLGYSPNLPSDVSEVAPAQKDAMRAKLVEIVSATANNCLSELGYYPGIKQNIAFLENRCNGWQEENVKLFEDNRKLNKAVQNANEQLQIARQTQDLYRMPENALMQEVVSLRSQVNSLLAQIDELQQQNARLAANPTVSNADRSEHNYAQLYHEHQAALAEIHALRSKGSRGSHDHRVQSSHPPTSAHPTQQTQPRQGIFHPLQAGPSTAVIPNNFVSQTGNINTQPHRPRTIPNPQVHHAIAPQPQFYITQSPPPSNGAPSAHHPSSGSKTAPRRVVSADASTTHSQQAHSRLSPQSAPYRLARNDMRQLRINQPPSNIQSASLPASNASFSPHTPVPPGQLLQSVAQSSRPQTAPPHQNETRSNSFDHPTQPQNQVDSVSGAPTASNMVQRTQLQQPPHVLMASARPGSAPSSTGQQLPYPHSAAPYPGLSVSVPLFSQKQFVSSPTQMSPVVTIPPAQIIPPPPPQETSTFSIAPSDNQSSKTDENPAVILTRSMPVGSSPIRDSEPTQHSVQIDEAAMNLDSDTGPNVEEEEGEEDETDDEDEVMEVDEDGFRPIAYVLGLMFENVENGARLCRFCMSRFRSGAVEERPTPFINEDDAVLVQHCQEQHPIGWAKVRNPNSDI